MITKEARERAYQIGAQRALVDTGLVKEARPFWKEEPGSPWAPAIGSLFEGALPLAGPITGAIAAPSGERLKGFGGTLLGELGGGIAGGLSGAALAALLKKNPLLPALVGAGLGTPAGAYYGYSKAMDL